MAKQRIVNTHFWRDSYILSLKPNERLMFLWVITNPATDLCGAYEAALPTIELETGLKERQILDAFGKFTQDGKILYRDGWVIIRNFTKHQNGTSTNIKKGAERSLSGCPNWVKDTLLNGITPVPNRALPEPELLPEPEPIGTHNATAFPEPEFSYPMRELVEAFPNLTVTPAMIGFIEPEVLDTPVDREAWATTLKTYQMNYDPALKRYMPDKVGNLLGVFRSEKDKLERKNGTRRTPNTSSGREIDPLILGNSKRI